MKYIFFDVDRTLLCRDKEQPYILDSTKLALQKLQEKGHMVAIATGRNFALAYDYMNEFGLKNMVVDGGNSFVIDKQLIEAEPMDKEICDQLIKECEEKGFSYAIVKDTTNRYYSKDPRFIDNRMKAFWRCQIVDEIKTEEIESYFAIHIFIREEEMEQLPALKKLTYTRISPERLHVEPTEKSKGIKKVVDYFGGDYKDVVVFGDGTNDLDMFEQDWLKIAMGNSVDIIKQLADYVTDDCNKDGIYNACQHFHWFEE